MFLGVSKCVWSGCTPGQSCWLLPSAVVGYLQLCHHLHCAKTLIPRLGGNQVGDPSRYWPGLRSARLAAFCFGWAETLSLGANPCQWLWPPVLSLLMCRWLRSWLQVRREPLLPSAVLSGLSKNAWVSKNELSECEQHVLVAKLAERVHQSAIMSHWPSCPTAEFAFWWYTWQIPSFLFGKLTYIGFLFLL